MTKLEDEIAHFYRVYLKREPDEAGLKHYLSGINSGEISIDDVPKMIQLSDEYKSINNIPPLQYPEYFKTSNKKFNK